VISARRSSGRASHELLERDLDVVQDAGKVEVFLLAA
jgi:hypothetical protein